MEGIYLSLEEAAEIEEVSYETLKKRIQRKEDLYSIKIVLNENGGKDKLLVELSSLSSKANRNYKAKTSIDVAEKKFSTEQNENLPWYVDIDVSWYKEQYPVRYYEAIELSKSIQQFLSYEDQDKTMYAEEFAQRLKISQRTLYRYAKSYLEASAWAYKLGMKDNCNYDYFKSLSLCRKPKESGKFPSIRTEVRTTIENIWFDKMFAANAGTKEMLYAKLEGIALAKGWNYPSYQTVVRYINHIMYECHAENAHYLLAKGEREYKNRKMTKAVRNISALKVMEMVQGDEHTFDCWVSYKNKNGKISAIKPKLVAWIDMKSRAIMGDIMCKDANMQIVKQSFIKMIYSEIGGVPRYVLIDNGKDYTAEAMTGLKRNQRRADKSEDTIIKLDSETTGFYESIGIQDAFRALPYEAWVKAQIERFFGGVCTRFTKWFATYTGTLTGSKTAAKIKKDIPKMLERGELLSLEEFYSIWEKWRDEFYMKKVHRGLKEQKEEYTTPYECFMYADEESRYFKAAPPRSYAAMLMMKADKVLVQQVGIKRFGYYYNAPELYDYIHKKVNIKYDPEDVTRLYVYSEDGKKICEALSQELLLVAPRITQEALTEHMKNQRMQIKQDKQKIKEYQKTLLERNTEYTEADSTVGGIDLTIGKKQKQNVVSLPADRQYAEETLEKKNTPEKEESEFFSKRAQAALNKLRQLG